MPLALGKALIDHDGTWVVGPEASSLGSFGREVALDAITPDVRAIDGGPVELPASDLARFWLLSGFCDTDAETDILLAPPTGSCIALPKPEAWMTFHRRGGRTYLEVAWRPPQPRLRTYRSIEEVPSSRHRPGRRSSSSRGTLRTTDPIRIPPRRSRVGNGTGGP
ncbi:hypothetical protein ACYOEI_34245 [Singulisphaera rosea]